MSKDKESYLTSSQLTLILVGSMIGISALTLPRDLLKTAQQDGWISCILGTVYPLYFTLIAKYLHKRFPAENILMLSKRYCGKFLGSILNLIFVLFFLLILTEVAAGISDILGTYMVPFLSRNKLIISVLLPPAFVSYKGIKTLARLNEVIFYTALIILLLSIAALKEGHLFNITPVFGSGVINLIKSTKETILSYAGIEILLIIYPFFKDNKKIKSAGIKSTVFVSSVYTWVTFITIFYLGIDIIPKFIWPVIQVAESITIPVITSFRYIFMSLWTMIMFRVLANFYYAFAFGLSELITCVNRKSIVILTYPLIFYLATKYRNPIIRSAFLEKSVPKYALYNVLYVALIAILMEINKDRNCK